MKNILPLLVVALLTCGAWPCRAASVNGTSTLVDTLPPSNIPGDTPAFAAGIDDLPLMPGLGPVAGESTVYLTPHERRTADSVAIGSVDVDEVYDFYRDSLPQLGWKRVSARSYERNGQILSVDAHADGKVTTVHFSVKPR